MKYFAAALLIFTAFFFGPSPKIYAQNDQNMAETVVHLLSYVSMDYSGAVENGEVIDEMEYLEQQDFSNQAYILTQEANFVSGQDKEKLLALIQNLKDLVDDKASEDEISSMAGRINSRIITITGIQTAPKVWPDLAYGKELYDQTCATCHGSTGLGDGLAGQGLEPAPSNFHEEDLMENFSAYQAFNSIRLGVPGTGMQAYSEYNEAELWSLAFYVKSLRFEDTGIDKAQLQKEFDEILPKIGLKEAANLTDAELLDTLTHYTKNPETKLRALRLLAPSEKMIINSLPIAAQGLQDALKSYSEGNRSLARTQAISAYLDGIEPVEARLRTINRGLVADIENQMFIVRQAIEKDRGVEVLQTETDKALALIDQANDLMKGQKLNYWLTFIIAASIFLREALEAFLIIAVILTLIKKVDAKKALPWLHGGWITAIIAGIAGWFLSDYILQFGGKNREIMEGLVALFAVAVLLFMGFWLHSKTEAQQWTRFIKDKIGGYLKTDRMMGLAVFSFFVVFREAFEVILFLQAVSLEAAAENQSAIGLGVLAATVCIIGIAYAFFKFSKMIPVRKVFLYSSWMILLLAVILMGKGIHALQESGWISVTNLPQYLRIEWLGIYPTLETIFGQIFIISLMAVVYVIQKQRIKKLAYAEE